VRQARSTGAAADRIGRVGQHAPGTACRRFFFANAYLELLWVDDAAEAGSEPAKRTRLLDRWALRRAGACPFGVILRPSIDAAEARPPFPTWSYTPPYLPAGLAIDVADGTPLAEPAVFYMAVPRSRGRRGGQPIDHEPPVRTVSRVSIEGPLPGERSAASRALEDARAVVFADASAYLLTLDFSGAPEAIADLRPGLPLVLLLVIVHHGSRCTATAGGNAEPTAAVTPRPLTRQLAQPAGGVPRDSERR
jgi:hypothetical protein